VGKPIWFGAIFKLTRSTHVAAPAGAAKAIAATAMPLVKAQCNVNRVMGCLSFVLAVQTSRLRAPEADGFVGIALPAWVRAVRAQTPDFRQVEHLAQGREHTVSVCGDFDIRFIK
jgi:hypothetical protein